MDCPTCEAMVDAYVDGELSASESADFERSLAACPECRRRLETARAMSGLLRALPTEPAPDLLRARVERELRAIAGTAARAHALGGHGGEHRRGGRHRLAGRRAVAAGRP